MLLVVGHESCPADVPGPGWDDIRRSEEDVPGEESRNDRAASMAYRGAAGGPLRGVGISVPTGVLQGPDCHRCNRATERPATREEDEPTRRGNQRRLRG